MTTKGNERDRKRLATMRLSRAYEEALVELQHQGAPGTCT